MYWQLHVAESAHDSEPFSEDHAVLGCEVEELSLHAGETGLGFQDCS